MTTLTAGGIAVSVLIVALWIGRTVRAEVRVGRGEGQPLHRGRLVRGLDVILWVLGIGWVALLATFFTLSFMGA